jgi:RHS repeat-associated protein
VYDAYGKTQILSGSGTMLADSSVGNPFMFTGRYNHPRLDLMYFRARMYDMVTGNFISQDPLGFVDGMSLYRGYFVPIGMDPSGSEFFPGTTFSNLKFDGCSCTKVEAATIETAWGSARKAAKSAVDEIKEITWARDAAHYAEIVTILRRYRIFFETPVDDQGTISGKTDDDWGISRNLIRTTIKSVFEKTRYGMLGEVEVYCAGDYCEGDTAAYTYNGDSLVFCPKFFDGKTPKQKAGIAFHEASHRWGDTNDWGYMMPQPAIAAMADDGHGKPLFGNFYWNTYSIGYDGSGYMKTKYLVDNASTYEHYLLQFHCKGD